MTSSAEILSVLRNLDSVRNAPSVRPRAKKTLFNLADILTQLGARFADEQLPNDAPLDRPSWVRIRNSIEPTASELTDLLGNLEKVGGPQHRSVTQRALFDASGIAHETGRQTLRCPCGS